MNNLSNASISGAFQEYEEMIANLKQNLTDAINMRLEATRNYHRTLETLNAERAANENQWKAVTAQLDAIYWMLQAMRDNSVTHAQRAGQITLVIWLLDKVRPKPGYGESVSDIPF